MYCERKFTVALAMKKLLYVNDIITVISLCWKWLLFAVTIKMYAHIQLSVCGTVLSNSSTWYSHTLSDPLAAYRFCFGQAPVNKLIPVTSLWAL